MSSLYSAAIFTLNGSLTSKMTNPFFLFDAPSRVITATSPFSETLTSLTVLASTVTVSMICIFSGSVTSQKYASPFALHVPVTAKSLPLCFPTPGHTQRSDVCTLGTVPCPTNFAFFLTSLFTTSIVFLAENPPDSANIVKIPGVSATNFPSSFINAEAGKPIPYSAVPVNE